MCLKLTITGAVLVFLLLTLNIFHTLFCVSIVNFEKVNLPGMPILMLFCSDYLHCAHLELQTFTKEVI